MRYLLIFLGLVFLYSCSDKSTCIDDRMATFQEVNNERGFTFIYNFVQEGKTYYIFDSGIAFDATAEVIDEDCNTVCVYGGNRPDPVNSCQAYQEGIGNAVQIWPK